MAMKPEEPSKLYNDAEYGVLGALLIDPALVAAELFSRVSAEDFIHGDCRTIFEAALEMYNRGDRIDALTVLHVAGENYRSFLEQLMQTTPTAYNFTAYIDLLLDWSKRYRVSEIAAQLSGLCAIGAPVMEILDANEQMTAVLSSGTNRDTYHATDLQGLAFVGLDRKRQYLDWGYDKLNQVIYADCQDKDGCYIVIGARPSTGKTAFALNVALHMAQKHRVVFFSFETGARGIAERIETAETGVDFEKIKRGTLNEQDMAELVRHKKRLCALHFTMVRASGLTAEAIRARAQRERAEVVIVDYLQLVACTDRRMSDYERTTYITRALQQMARSGMCVIALSQLSRDTEGGIRALRGSGQIEQDADVVMLLEFPGKGDLPEHLQEDAITDEQRARLRVLNIAKNRDGRTGSIHMQFDGAHQRFRQGWSDFFEVKGKAPAFPRDTPKKARSEQVSFGGI